MIRTNPLKDMGYIIIETGLTNKEYPVKITVDRNGTNKVTAEGTLQEANMKNRNQRWYSDNELFPQITCPRTQELVTTGNMRAENGHPMDSNITRQSTIDPNNTVAIFTALWTEGNFVKGRFRGTNNAKGEEFNQDLLDGFLPSWSLRALGRVEQTARGGEVKGLKLITYDRVIYPSHDKAYTEKIVSEGACIDDSGIVENGNRLYLTENDSGLLIPIISPGVIDFVKQESANLKMFTNDLEFEYNDISITENVNQVRLVNNKTGDIAMVNIEDQVRDEIINHCMKKYM